MQWLELNVEGLGIVINRWKNYIVVLVLQVASFQDILRS
jgi:hypothetical protein